ncbi:MAG: glycosyltransferase family 39 protein, partial [Chloroflexi bacterium]|nr:glycosyltransferase family 39 protein [Chloroflexota bacterium]
MKRPLLWALALLVPAALYILGAAHGAPRPEYSPSTTQHARLNPNTIYHPDEFAYVGIPYRMLLHKEWNPHYYHNPSLNLYTNLGMFMLSNAKALPHNTDYGEREIAPFALYFSARYFSALYTLLSVVLSYLAGRVAFNRKAGIITAALLGLSPLMVQHAHYATPIAQTTLLSTAAVAWAVLLLRDRLPLWIGCAVGGLLVGLAMSARYNAATVGVVSGLAMLAVTGQQRRFLPLLAGAAALPLGFALGTPGIIFATHEVTGQIQDILDWYKTEGGGPGFTAERGLESFYYHWRYVALVALGPAALL